MQMLWSDYWPLVATWELRGICSAGTIIIFFILPLGENQGLTTAGDNLSKVNLRLRPCHASMKNRHKTISYIPGLSRAIQDNTGYVVILIDWYKHFNNNLYLKYNEILQC